MPTTYMCEYDGCEAEAVYEHLDSDEDGDMYITFRCAKHPVDSDERRKLST